MLAYEDALERVIAAAARTPTETVLLPDALGRVLAEPLDAPAPLPPFDTSAMDGYAVRGNDVAVPGTELRVIGESRTGKPAPSLTPGTACRIFTGAPLPDGADAVVMQENVTRRGDTAVFEEVPRPGRHIRRAGEDLARGARALEAGVRVGPFQLGLAAALDRARLQVATRPRVIVISTGDELRPPGSPPRPASIPESNSFVVRALAAHASADVLDCRVAPDDPDETRTAIARALAESDVLVTIGGVSVGDHDVVRPALEAAGAELSFWKVAIKPGKPLVLGRAPQTTVLGLPGNPVSAQITFALFGLPLLRAMQGDRRPVPAPRRGRLTAPLAHKPGRRGFYRAALDGHAVTPLAGQGSGATTSMAWASCLVSVPPSSGDLAAGAEVDVLAFGDL